MSVLALENITVHYPNQPSPTLQNINLDVPEHHITVIVGASGCGKTTLLNVAAGFILPNTGTIKSHGRLVHGPDSDRTVVFQDDALMPWLNVLENVALGLRIKGLDLEQQEQLARKQLQQVGLEHAQYKHIWELSGGMRQRVGIARALAVDSPIVLMDEPFAALDAFMREQMQELVLSLWQQRQTAFLLITHDIEEALILASQLIVMKPAPSRIHQTLNLDFNQRWVNGENIRQIKSDPEFIKLREMLFHELVAEEVVTQ